MLSKKVIKSFGILSLLFRLNKQSDGGLPCLLF